MVQTSIPMLNVALSGTLDGGLTPGLTVIAGPSKHFKTLFTLMMVRAYQEKYKDAIVLFYDSEFGSPQDYFKSLGIDTERILHTPVTDVEILKHDIMSQLDEIKRGAHLMIILDSLGNLASRKEVDDALSGKNVADMTRAKQIKSLFRMVTPHLTMKDIPMVVVNHIYEELGLYPKKIVSGGTGVTLSADNIWIVGRQQEKEGTEVVGWDFIINVEKSRFVKEKSKIPISVTYEGGISTWSGLLDIALESGHVVSEKQGWYKIAGGAKSYRKADTNTKEFWMPILENKTFRDYISDKYKLGYADMLKEPTNASIDEEYENAEA